MHITRKNYNLSAAVFVAAEISLLVFIQLTNELLNTALSYSAVLLALAFTVFCYTGGIYSRISLVAMAATACADLFLVVIEPALPVFGMLFFSLVQAAYFLKIYLKTDSRRLRLVHLCVRLSLLLVAIVCVFLVLRDNCDFLAVISVLYYVNLLLNFIFSLFLERTKKNILLTVGLFCFLMCDLFVGFGMIEPYIPISEGSFAYFLAYPGFNAAWLFYVPSLVLLALSSNS